MDRRVIAVAAGLTLSLAGIGCGGYTKTVRVEERTHSSAPAPVAQQQISTVTETTTVRQPAPRRGVLSTTVHVIGEVLAWPFRLVGGLLRAIF